MPVPDRDQFLVGRRVVDSIEEDAHFKLPVLEVRPKDHRLIGVGHLSGAEGFDLAANS